MDKLQNMSPEIREIAEQIMRGEKPARREAPMTELSLSDLDNIAGGCPDVFTVGTETLDREQLMLVVEQFRSSLDGIIGPSQTEEFLRSLLRSSVSGPEIDDIVKAYTLYGPVDMWTQLDRM